MRNFVIHVRILFASASMILYFMFRAFWVLCTRDTFILEPQANHAANVMRCQLYSHVRHA
eukprot:2195504-Amphidinium_carterae.4